MANRKYFNIYRALSLDGVYLIGNLFPINGVWTINGSEIYYATIVRPTNMHDRKGNAVWEKDTIADGWGNAYTVELAEDGMWLAKQGNIQCVPLYSILGDVVVVELREPGGWMEYSPSHMWQWWLDSRVDQKSLVYTVESIEFNVAGITLEDFTLLKGVRNIPEERKRELEKLQCSLPEDTVWEKYRTWGNEEWAVEWSTKELRIVDREYGVTLYSGTDPIAVEKHLVAMGMVENWEEEE